MAGYIGSVPVPQATETRDVYTATSNQTTFTTGGYTPNFVSVYLNGVHLARADYTATNGSDVVLAVGAAADDTVEIVSFATFEVSAQTFTGDVTASGGTFLPTGDTEANDVAAVGYTEAEGLILTGQGSTNDVTIKNGADADVIEIPTGTVNVTMAGTLGVTGVITGGGLVVPDGSIAVADLDIDGATDIGAAIVDADLMIIDDGAGGTNRKATMTRLATYMGTKGLGPAYTRSATAPSSPNQGDWWYHTGMLSLFIYDGTDGWITDSERKFGSGLFITANTFSLLVRPDGNINKIRFEPESAMAIDQGVFVSHTYVDNTTAVEAVSNSSRGVFTQKDTATSNQYAYVTIATNGTASDFGNSNVIINNGIGCDHATRGVFSNGSSDGTTPINTMEYITIASAGNGTDFGDLTVARRFAGCQAIANTTRGVFCGGFPGSGESNVMDYITIASAGNATDFGDLTSGSYNHETANSIVRGLIFGGESGRLTIDYITIASTGNASDFGDHLSTASPSRNNGWCIHNKLYAYYGRESLGTQEKHTIATAANATAFEFSEVTPGSAYSHAPIKGWIAASG